MKKGILNSLTTAFILSLVIFMSCGPDGGDDTPDGPGEFEQQLMDLSRTWNIVSTNVDGSPVEGWENFAITLGGTANDDDVVSGTYSSNGNQPDGTDAVWPASGTWTFGGSVTTVDRNDGVTISATLNGDNTQLTLTFDIADQGGRSDIVAGRWVQIFN